MLAQCWPRLRFTADIEVACFETLVEKVRAAGFLVETPDLRRFLLR